MSIASPETDEERRIASAADASYEAGWGEGRSNLLQDMLGELSPEAHTAMLVAAGEIPLERENGGLEYPPFKVFKAMLRAYAATRGIELEE